MKFVFLYIVLSLGLTVSTAQTNFQNVWELQNNSENNIEIKITQSSNQVGLSFILEGLMRKTSRIFITGELELQALNQYKYQDKNTNCNVLFNFINKDSMYLEANLCDLYTLNDSVDGLYTSNYDDLLTPKIFGKYDEVIEKEIERKTGENFEAIKLNSVHKIQINSTNSSTVYMASTDSLVKTDPQVIYYLEDNKISIFYRFKDIINSYISPYHKTISKEITNWMKKERMVVVPEKQ